MEIQSISGFDIRRFFREIISVNTGEGDNNLKRNTLHAGVNDLL